MLLNMALVWLMMYFSICLMIIISIWSMIIVSREYFEITFISRKKGLCWPSFWDYLHFDIRSAQSIKAIFDAPRFEMIYDFHLQMSRANFRPQNYFRQENPEYFIDENTAFFTIFVHSFLRSVYVPTLALKYILRKEKVCYVRF